MNTLEKASASVQSVEAIWNDSKALREQFGKGLTEQEFGFFMGLGAMLKANPFTREIWAVKYGSNQAQIFLGRDFYRRKAQEQAEYNGHTAAAVYEHDKFIVLDGKPTHEYKLTNRGALVGGYCVVYRKSTAVPFTVFVELREYNTGQSNWKTKPATMIAKVAEAQALRGAFSGVFNGTYSEDEEAVIAEQQTEKRSSARKSVDEIFGTVEVVEEAKEEDQGASLQEQLAYTADLFEAGPRMSNEKQLAYISEHAHLLSAKSQDSLAKKGDSLTYEEAEATIEAIQKRGGPEL